MLRYGGGTGVVLLGPVVQGFKDDEEVDVAVGAGVAAGVAAEEDDLLRVESFGDQLGNGLKCRPVDSDFAHVDQIPWSRTLDWACTRIYHSLGGHAGVSVGDSFRSLASCRSRILWLRFCQKANCSALDFPANC